MNIRRTLVNRLLPAVLLFLSFTVSCSRDDGGNVPLPSDSHSRLVKVTDTFTPTLDEIKALFALGLYNVMSVDIDRANTVAGLIFNNASRGLNTVFSNEGIGSWHAEQINFTYRSVTSTGDSATFSGLVAFPCSDDGTPHTIGGLSLYSDFLSIMDRKPEPDVIAFGRALSQNEACIMSDTQGFGVTAGMQRVYFDGKAKAIQTVDAAAAALEILKSRNIVTDADAYTEIIGTSLGCHPSLWALRYLESDECPEWQKECLPNPAAAAMCGPLEPKELFLSYMEDDVMAFSFLPLMMIPSIFGSFPDLTEGYSISDFYSKSVNENMITIDGKTGTLPDLFTERLSSFSEGNGKLDAFHDFNSAIKEHYYGRVKLLVTPDIFDADSIFDPDTPKSRILLEALDRYGVAEGWSPAHNVLLAHSKEDTAMKYVPTMHSVKKLMDSSRKVDFILLSGDHSDSAGAGLIRMLLLKHPSVTVSGSDQLYQWIIDNIIRQ